MEVAERKRVPSEILKRGYSDDEIAHIYELGRLHLENGNIRPAELIMRGLVQIAPDYAPAWLGAAYIDIQNDNIDKALFASRQALRIDPNFTEAMLYLIACLLSSGDFNSAGTHLGEIGENIDNGIITDPNHIRFFRAQLVRFRSR